MPLVEEEIARHPKSATRAGRPAEPQKRNRVRPPGSADETTVADRDSMR